MSDDLNPYQSTVTISSDTERTIPIWRRLLGSLFRIFGGLVIAVPIVGILIEFQNKTLAQVMSLRLEFIVALLVYMVVGGTFVFCGNLLSPKKRRAASTD